jgi:hypothetical protein
MQKSLQKKLVVSRGVAAKTIDFSVNILKSKYMGSDNLQTGNNGSNCCVDDCKETFTVAGQQVVNNFKCNQKQFSVSDLWYIQKNKRELSIRTTI